MDEHGKRGNQVIVKVKVKVLLRCFEAKKWSFGGRILKLMQSSYCCYTNLGTSSLGCVISSKLEMLS